MMETVLNIGLNDESVQGLAKQAGSERFAWDSYRRLIQMFGKTVLDIDGEHFEDAHRRGQEGPRHRPTTSTSTSTTCASSSTPSRASSASTPAASSRTDPREQMDLAVRAVFDSWNADRARSSTAARSASRPTSAPRSTSWRWSSATSAWTPAPASPSPATRAPAQQGIYGDYLQNAQGEDVVAGIRNTLPLQDLEGIDKPAYDQLLAIMATLENHYRDLCDIEFTIERNKLWMLQTRVGKRTAGAAFRIATQLVDQGLIDLDEALDAGHRRPARPADVPALRRERRREADRQGHERLARAPRSARPSSTPTAPSSWPRKGETVILVRRETNPDDLTGMIAAQGILTSRGGKTCHAAVVARGMGKTCVCGAEELDVDLKGRKFTARGGVVVEEGDVISIDGTTGAVYLGEVPGPAVAGRRVLRGQRSTRPRGRRRSSRPCTGSWSTPTRSAGCGVRANSDTPEDSERARRFGAEGIGLCRTEHMFLGERRQLVEDLILADGDDERAGGAGRAGAAAARGLRRHLHARWTGCRSRSG